jgi:hypothetical protein
MVISASANFHLAGTWLGPAGPGYLDKMPQRKHSAWLPSTSRVDTGYVEFRGAA